MNVLCSKCRAAALRRDFIAEHEADSYARHKEPVLNNNWLEEIARKVRAASEPVLLTVKRLQTAMLDQH